MPVIAPAASARNRTPSSTGRVSEVSIRLGTAARSHREHGHTSAGAALLTVTVTPEDTEVFPAASRATAVITCMPPAAVVVSHARVYGADDCSGPAFTLSILNCTPATPTSSDAAADKATVPETVAPSIGGGDRHGWRCRV